MRTTVLAILLLSFSTVASAGVLENQKKHLHLNPDFTAEVDLMDDRPPPMLFELGVQWGRLELRSGVGKASSSDVPRHTITHFHAVVRYYPASVSRDRIMVRRRIELVAPYLEGGATVENIVDRGAFTARPWLTVGAGFALRMPNRLSITLGLRHRAAPGNQVDERWLGRVPQVAQRTAANISIGVHW